MVDASGKHIMEKIEEIVFAAVECIASGRSYDLAVMIPVHARAALGREPNVAAGPTEVLKCRRWARHPVKFMRTVQVIALVYWCLRNATELSQREVFYVLRSCFQSQRQADEIVLDAVHLLDTARWKLNLTAASTGTLGGSILVQAANDGREAWVDCESLQAGYPIPGDVNRVMSMRFRTKDRPQFIIVVEKYGIFQSMRQDGLVRRVAAILVCGHGYPAISTRALTWRLEQTLSIPVVGLADYNPDGFQILNTYRGCAARSSYEAERFGVPVAWLGLRSSHIDRLRLGRDLAQPLTDRDNVLVDRLVRENGSSPERARELMRMRDGKYELQALFTLGATFLAHSYLPTCLLRRDFL